MIEFNDQHKQFRQTVRDFIDKEIRPHVLAWEEQGFTPREIWKKCGSLGLLGIPYDEAYGGMNADHTFLMIFTEEMAQCGSLGVALGLAVQTDMSTPALHRHGSEELKKEILVPAITGDFIGAIAVTEPDCGSDAAGLKTLAKKTGSDYVINGTKMFITNGTQADFFTTLVRTSNDPGHKCFTLFAIPAKTKGISRGKKLQKVCHLSSDTAEVVFDNVKISEKYRIGEENKGFIYQMEQFQAERLAASVQMLGVMKRCYKLTVDYVQSRKVFGRQLSELQVTKHKLAQMVAEITGIETLAYHCIELANAQKDYTREVSMLKLLGAQTQQRITEECVQLHGGYGLMAEYEVARYFRDSKLSGIGGGSNEVMKEIIAKREKY